MRLSKESHSGCTRKLGPGVAALIIRIIFRPVTDAFGTTQLQEGE